MYCDLSGDFQYMKQLMETAEKLVAYTDFMFHPLLMNDTKRLCTQV